MKTKQDLQNELNALRARWAEIDNQIFAEAHKGQSPELTMMIRYQHAITSDIASVKLQLLSHDHEKPKNSFAATRSNPLPVSHVASVAANARCYA